jgi:hypothetical protein
MKFLENMDQREKKRIVIASVYAVVFMVLVVLVVSKMLPDPTCFDGIKNQNEADTDCGGVCAKKCDIKLDDSIVVNETGWAENGLANKYDVYSSITNPNKEFGSNVFNYTFSLLDSGENVIAAKEGQSFILPGEKKYLIEIGIESKASPQKVKLEIKNMKWQEFPAFERPELRIVNKNYNEISNASGSSEVVGVLRNDSSFDFNEIKIKAVLKNAGGKVIALNSTKMNTVQTGENREFRFFWPYKISGVVSNMEIQPEVNIFASDAFVEKYFKEQVF